MNNRDKWFHTLELNQELAKPYVQNLSKKISVERNLTKIYPKSENIFAFFDKCPIEDFKVVIVDTEPYCQESQADGLAFSMIEDFQFPTYSLRTFFTCIEETLYNGFCLNQSTDLTRWSNQGVLLMNRILTVEKNVPCSHKGYGWEIFTNFVIQKINEKFKNIIFLLVGSEAQTLNEFISTKHTIFNTEHPIDSIRANRRWSAINVFSEINIKLESFSKQKILW